MTFSVKILKAGPRPAIRKGRRKKWDLPLDKLGDDDLILIQMNEDEARDRINSVRAAIGRYTRDTGIRFSVYLTNQGIKIWKKDTPSPAEEVTHE